MSRTLVYAHRGAKREAAENTRSAFEKALAYPIDGIETDVQLSRDGVAVLWHDDFLCKLGLPGDRIDDFDHAVLQAMNFAAHFSGSQPEGVMSLREFMEAYRTRCRLLLEIKGCEGEPAARREARVRRTLELAGEAMDGRILVSSFDLDSMICAHHCKPGFPLVLNLEPEHGADFARQMLDGQPFLCGLCVHVGTLDETMIGIVRGYGKRIAVYTCNSDEEIGRALALGVDILISDVPQKALQMRDG